MKPIQIMIDEELLEELDAREEVQREGRSAVLRRALSEYLRRHRSQVIRECYGQAYGSTRGLGEEFSGWEGESEWPGE